MGRLGRHMCSIVPPCGIWVGRSGEIMKTSLVRIVLACAALALSSTAAFATVTPSQGTPIGLEHDPEGIIAHAATGPGGRVTFRDLKPGNYVLVLSGKDLVAAMDKFAPPAGKQSGGGLSIGVGGKIGGGGRSSPDRGAAPGRESGARTGGGAGVGVAIPIGGTGNSASSSAAAAMLTFTITVTPTAGAESAATFSSTTPYCRDTAGPGVRIGFTVTNNGGSTSSVSASLGFEKTFLDGRASSE